MANIEITYTKNARGDYDASIDLHKVCPYITGGTLYAYGSTEEEAHRALMHNIEQVIDKLSKIE